ncbi:MAG TPA: protein-methionine-sulfoxide reductase catalytic subunit MsrP [Candidatus Angelobacter sp.]|jgi:sulfoxide reductase catalytic subunit YedY|nr:protein-methionine-sulfoxide reductase catalytic subunit MsrP [Candidatus Angelobacter sp.]
MLIKKQSDIPSSEITSKSNYMDRRKFIAGAAATGAALATGLYLRDAAATLDTVEASSKLTGITKSQFSTTEKPNSLKDITNYNNYYEFSTDKYEPNGLSKNFRARPWTVSIEGAVAKPKKMDIDEFLKLAPLEERIYRFRCVEGWSMVIPWVGFPLNALMKQVEPLGKAKFVAFETILAPNQMPGQNQSVLQWPYVEGLRMDEAMHPLTILAVGIYDEVLPNVDGAPIRLVVPWKYGFKSIKAIVKIKFVEKMPPTSWNRMAPNEYGFYSNVNPQVDHPRWSQAKERRIGEFFKRETLMLNGYGDQVASLYSGMDLRKNF